MKDSYVFYKDKLQGEYKDVFDQVEMYVKVGDKVITSQYAGNPVKIDGVEYSIVRQGDILAIVE